MDVIKYDKSFKDLWEEFVISSNNGTIFHKRKFLSYHPPERFKDNSLLFINNNKIISVITAVDIEKKERKYSTLTRVLHTADLFIKII